MEDEKPDDLVAFIHKITQNRFEGQHDAIQKIIDALYGKYKITKILNDKVKQ